MLKITKFLILAFLISALNISFASQVDNSDVRIIIKYYEKNPQIQKKLPKTFKNTYTLKRVENLAGDRYVLVFENPAKNKSVHNQNISNLLKALRADKSVNYAVIDKVGYFNPIIAPPHENYSRLPSHEMQWNQFSPPQGVMLESAAGLKDGAWQYTTGESTRDIVIAVLDTGIALNESLMSNLVKDPSNGKIWGWNFSQNNSDLTDETLSYHGTHVAGIIAASGDYIKGVGEKLKILPIKIPSRNGMFYESWVINALYWSVGGDVPGAPQNIYPARVLNMSFGVDVRPGEELDICDEALQEAIDFVRSKNAVIVVAAGNDNRFEHFNAPAVCKGTLKIAATGPHGHRAYYSNYGPSINFAAPGGDIRYGRYGAILSTVRPDSGYLNSGFDFYQGTSMASPHVAGVAGLVAAVNDQLDVSSIENLLTLTTHNFGHGASENYSCVGKKPCGNGIVDAYQAVKAAKANYHYLFSTPTSNKDALAGTPFWEQIDIQINKLRSTPYLYQDEEGNIFAEVENKLFKLKAENFSKCDIIGFNGVGCYK